MAVAKIERIKPKKVLRNQKEVRQFLTEGVYDLGSSLLLFDNQRQARRQPPEYVTAVKLDRRTTPIREAEGRRLARLPPGKVRLAGRRRRIGFIYGQSVDIFKAVRTVYLDLVRLTRYQSGRGVGTIYFWCVDKDDAQRGVRFSTLGQVQGWLQDPDRGSRVTVHILGPTVVYRRKLVYNPRGRQYQSRISVNSRRLRGTAIDRLVNRTGDQVTAFQRTSKSGRVSEYVNVSVAVHRIVVRRNKRKFPGAWMSYAFVPSREKLPPDRNTGKSYGQGPGFGNIPVIYVGGAVRRNKRS